MAIEGQKYDILRDTWIYQEIRQEIMSELQQHFLQTQQQLLLKIVEARFPRLLALANTIVPEINETSTVQELILNISVARLEKEVRQILSDAHKNKE